MAYIVIVVAYVVMTYVVLAYVWGPQSEGFLNQNARLYAACTHVSAHVYAYTRTHVRTHACTACLAGFSRPI